VLWTNEYRTNKKSVLLRHPIFFGAAIIVAAVIVFAPKTPERKKLDYSKPVYTTGYAILCPQSLFFDLRADHDANAIFEVFTSISHRDEKAKALGCEVVREGIPVQAHRMDAPFNDYVAVSLMGQQDSSLFTMEAELENDEAADSPSPATASTSGRSLRTPWRLPGWTSESTCPHLRSRCQT